MNIKLTYDIYIRNVAVIIFIIELIQTVNEVIIVISIANIAITYFIIAYALIWILLMMIIIISSSNLLLLIDNISVVDSTKFIAGIKVYYIITVFCHLILIHWLVIPAIINSNIIISTSTSTWHTFSFSILSLFLLIIILETFIYTL